MDFLVEFELAVPEGTPADVVDERKRAEASAAADLARNGHLVSLRDLPGGVSAAAVRKRGVP